MVFSSAIFLFAFLPGFLAVYYATPAAWRNAVIVIGSYLFYAWWRVDFVLLFGLVTIWNHAIAHRITATGPETADARRWMFIGVGGDLLILGYFKYVDFGIGSLNALFDAMGLPMLPLMNVILPIGISFYIFQAISYLVDVYRRDTPPSRNILSFAAFIALFPQLIAGPVLRYKDMADQFEQREHSFDLFAQGVERFMLGFVKKVMIADTLAPIADACFALEDPGMSEAWLGTIAYTAQLYFDFSGYSDMAIGLGLMMGFRFVENFNQPYVSQSITEFWRRWHMSLSNWLRDYLYIALGGNRFGTLLTYRNLALTMLLGGLWHGAAWTFVIWGAWHGALLALERALGERGTPTGFAFSRWLLTLVLVMIGWVFFRAESLAGALRMLWALLTPGTVTLRDSIAAGLDPLVVTTLLLAWSWVALGGYHSRVIAGESRLHLRRMDPRWSLLLAPLFVVSIAKLMTQSYSPFLYFQF